MPGEPRPSGLSPGDILSIQSVPASSTVYWTSSVAFPTATLIPTHPSVPTATEIGIGVAIPAFVIVLLLIFLYLSRHLRKETVTAERSESKTGDEKIPVYIESSLSSAAIPAGRVNQEMLPKPLHHDSDENLAMLLQSSRHTASNSLSI